MHEGDAVSAGARAGCLVYQLVTGLPAGGQGRIEIGNTVADVVNAGPAASKKSSDWTVRLERRQQLHERFTERQRHDGRAVGDFGRMRLDAEDVAVEGKGRIHIGHGNTNMGNPGAVSHAVAPTML